MANKITLLILILFSTFLLSQQSSIFWKISKGDTESYLLGTHHYFGKDFFSDNNIILDKLKSSKIAYSENIDSAKAFINIRNENPILNKLNDKELSIIQNLVPKNVNSKKMTLRELLVTVDSKISAKFCFAESEKSEGEKIDDFLKDYAVKNKIKLLGLEPTSKTFDYLNTSLYVDFDDNKLLKLLDDKIIALNSDKQNINCAIAQEYRSKKHNFNFSKEVQEKLITQRNIDWIDTIDKSIQANKNIFIFVGLYHLDFKNGLLELLKNRGYKVEPIELK